MVFSSIPFLYFFLPAVLLCYFAVPKKAKDFILLVFSLLFYWWGEPKYALLMVFTISFCYFAGRLIENRRKKSRECKALLIFSVAVPLGFLAVFKYADFFISSLNSLGADIPLLKLALPIGISFYTFQAISYIIDVYRGDIPAEKSLITLSAYITLFPQLIAGPIVRYKDVADDMKNRKINLKNASDGIRRFVYGIGKKVLIANLLGTICSVYRDSSDPSVLYAWVYAVSYSLQIYFDFSAYSDMAIGLGKILG
ncbi:MAG: MBOAT family protein, partial [Clostridia bacterium]|nr:MBOAT family protein [Clostridia bacterium]